MVVVAAGSGTAAAVVLPLLLLLVTMTMQVPRRAATMMRTAGRAAAAPTMSTGVWVMMTRTREMRRRTTLRTAMMLTGIGGCLPLWCLSLPC